MGTDAMKCSCYFKNVGNILCKGQISWMFGIVHDTDSKV